MRNTVCKATPKAERIQLHLQAIDNICDQHSFDIAGYFFYHLWQKIKQTLKTRLSHNTWCINNDKLIVHMLLHKHHIFIFFIFHSRFLLSIACDQTCISYPIRSVWAFNMTSSQNCLYIN